MHTSNKRLLGTLACLALVAGLSSGAPAEAPEGCSRSSKSISDQLLDLSNLVDPTGRLSEYIRNSLPSTAPAATSELPKDTTKDLASAASSQVATVVASTEVATPSSTPSVVSSSVTSELSTSPSSASSEPMRSEAPASVPPSSTGTSEIQPTTSVPSSTSATPVEVKASNVTVNVILQLEPDAKTEELINNPNILIPNLASSNAPAVSESSPVTTAPVVSSTVAPETSSTTAAPSSSTTDASTSKLANETTTSTKVATQTTAALLRRRRDIGSSLNATEVKSTTDAAVVSSTSVSSTPGAIVSTSSTSNASATDAPVTSTTSTTTSPEPAAISANATSVSTTTDAVSNTVPSSTTTTTTTNTTTTTTTPSTTTASATTSTTPAPSSTSAPSSSQPLTAASEQVITTTTSNSTSSVSRNSTAAPSSSSASNVVSDTSSGSVVEISAKALRAFLADEQGTTVPTVEIVVSPITNSSVNNETKSLPTNNTLESGVAKAADVAAQAPLPVLLPLLSGSPVPPAPVVAQQPANQKDVAGMLTEDMQEIASKLTETCLGHGQQPVNVEPLLKKNKRLQLGYASLDSSDPHSMINDPAAVDNLNVIYDNDTSLHIPGTTEPLAKSNEPSSTRLPNKQRPTQPTKFVINEPTEESERENFATCALEANLVAAKVAQLNQIGRLNFWQPIHQRGALHMLARFRYSKRPTSNEAPVQSLVRSKRESFRVPIEQVPGDGTQPIGRLVKHPIWLSSQSCATESVDRQNRSLFAEVSPTATNEQLVDADVEMLLARFNLDEGTNGIINKYLTVELPSGQTLACCQVISVPMIVATELENLPSVSVVQPTGLHSNNPGVTTS